MTRFVAAMIEVNDTGLVYSIDVAGIITPIKLSVYESLPSNDPRLDRVAWTRRQAERESLRVRGIETGLEVERLTN